MKIGISAICAIGWSLLLPACSGTKKDREESRPPVSVKVREVIGETSVGSASYVGTVHPVKSVLLSGRYPGKLVALPVALGDYVEQGETVAKIESPNVLSTQRMASATLAQAEDGYRRVRQVHGSGGIADVQMVEVETQLSKAKAAAEAADQAVEDCLVKAPFSGVVGEVFVDQGVELSPLDPIVRIVDISELEIRFPVPEKEIGRMRMGDSIRIVIPALSDKNVQAVLTTKGVTASVVSHSYDCVASLRSKVEGLMPGMVCKVYVDGNAVKGVEIPSSVVQMDKEGKYVWVVKDNLVEKRYVRLAGFSGKGVVVENGLQYGDLVITEGARKVSTGMTVKTVGL